MSDTPQRSYDNIPDFGLLYDSVPAYAARRDMPFYVQEAAQVQGPILEVGCGTGRITLALARAGHTVVGVDASEVMLARCHTNLEREDESVRDRVTLYQADARDLNLGATFGLAIAPFRVFQHLTRADDQLRFLHSVARHLGRGGHFAFDVFNPNFDALVRVDGIEREDTPELKLPDGRSLRRAARVCRVRWIEQVSETELIYYVAPRPGTAPHRYVQAFDMRWYLRAELTHLLERTGFTVQAMYGDFARSPLTDRSPEQVICARKVTTQTAL